MRMHAILGAALLTACNTASEPSAPVVAAPKVERPVDLMARVAKRAQACWYARKDRRLAGTRLAAELDSYSGKPRILIVPRNAPQGLPKLVAEAQRVGGRNRFQRYGPLLDAKLAADLDRWAAGNPSCTA